MDTELNVITPGSPGYDEILSSIKAGGWSVFCGSGVSIFEPTTIQSGMDVANRLAEAFCGEAGVDDCFRARALEIPYEVILSLYPRRDELDRMLSGYFRCGSYSGNAAELRPNAIHRVIASMLSTGIFRNAVTTNYDACIEAEAGDRVRVIVGHENLDSRSETTLLKLHGCAVRGSLIYAIDQEPRMPPAKVDLLRHTVGDKLIVVGYSGLDFEVCPELYSMALDRLVWVALPEKPEKPYLSRTARKVLSNQPGHAVLCADMRTIWRDLSEQAAAWGPALANPQQPTLSTLLLGALSLSEKRLWAARVFETMSAAAAIFPILAAEEAASGSLSRDFQQVRRGALNHAGLYRHSADLAGRMAEDEGLDGLSRLDAKLGEAGSAGMGAFEKRAARALREAQALLPLIEDEEKRADAAMRVEWLILLDERGAVDRKDAVAVATLADKFRAHRSSAEKRGDRGRMALCETEIKELVGEDGSGHDTGRMPEDAHDIFGRYGNIVGQVTAERDRARRTWNTKDAEVIKGRLGTLDLLGLEPEAWRVRYTLIHFRRDREGRLKLMREVERGMGRCQFEKSYVDLIRRKAMEAVDAPKGVAKVSD